jgi:hypothetical protein
MKIVFAYDKRYGSPYPVIPKIESGFTGKDKDLDSIVKLRECKSEDIGIDYVDGEDADLLIGNQAPFRQVLDLAKITWDVEKRVLEVSYIEDITTKPVDYKAGLSCDKVRP